MNQMADLDVKLSPETVKLIRKDIGEKRRFFVVAIDVNECRAVVVPDENGNRMISTSGPVNLDQQRALERGVSGEVPPAAVARIDCCQKQENAGHLCFIYDDGRECVFQYNACSET